MIPLSDLPPRNRRRRQSVGRPVDPRRQPLGSSAIFLRERRAALHHSRLSEGINLHVPGARSSLIERMGVQQAQQIGFDEPFHAPGWIRPMRMSRGWLTHPSFAGKSTVVDAGH